MWGKVNAWSRWARLGAVVSLAVMAAACGGGSAIEPFKPTRMTVYGDEMSLMEAGGRKYSVNAAALDPAAVDCSGNPLWIQTLASAFKLVFAECNPATAAVTAQIYAVKGAKASDFSSQLARAQAAAPLASKQLAAVFFGLNDILELYAQYPTRSRDELLAEMRQRGVNLGNAVNQVTTLGPAVLLVTAPDLGLAPFGLAQTAAFPDTAPTRGKFLSELTDAFNAGLRVTIINDGRFIGLVSADQMVRDIQGNFAAFYGFANVTQAACKPDVALLDCTVQTLVEGANGLTWAFADDKLFSAGLQARLGDIAASRALRNPF